jgi:hypothetical protein
MPFQDVDPDGRPNGRITWSVPRLFVRYILRVVEEIDWKYSVKSSELFIRARLWLPVRADGFRRHWRGLEILVVKVRLTL